MSSELLHRVRRRGALAGLLAVALVSIAPTTSALVLLQDELRPVKTLDRRPGKLLPDAAQLAAAAKIGGVAKWNRFGTIDTLIRHGGYLAESLGGTPVEAARQFIRTNRALFKLSATSVDQLELVNDAITPNNPGHAVLFRQRFGGLPATQDGLIMVAVVEGKVYYVSSSSAGDQPPPGPATLTPLQAWLTASADVGRATPLSAVKAVLDQNETAGWTMLKVAGFSQPQRARLTAIPIPAGGVRQAWETIVLDVKGGVPMAFVHFIDAQTGAVLRRENRVNWQAGGVNNTPYQGALTEDGAACGPRHAAEAPVGTAQLVVNVVTANPANDIKINLYYGEDAAAVPVGSYDNLLGAETYTYAPAGGVPSGTYQVEICPLNGIALPPYDYGGVITTSGTAASTVQLPSWSFYPANPRTDYSDEDTRALGCWVMKTGCDLELINTAARYPWDVAVAGNVPTNTTIGNNAVTAEAWGSPLTPAENYRPVSPSRSYSFPFTNAWHKSSCDPSNLHPTGNDIDAVVAQLFVTHNRMHDWAYRLGFTERNYNLQTSNFGNTDQQRENDPEVGNVQAGAISGSFASPSFYQAPGRDNANQVTLQDGTPGITNQYLFQPLPGIFYGPCADASLDMGVVGHEYTHAISNRMIGGPDSSITSDQGGAMGESWSDLDAMEYMMANGFLPVDGDSANPLALGPYATGDKDKGIRNFPLDANPLTYANYGYDTPSAEVHSDGEIWNAVQWALRQAFIDAYEGAYPYADRKRQQACADGLYAADACPGNRRWIQLIFDSFLLQQAGTSMLDARDAMLAADMARFGGANQKLMWDVFAKYGMGVNAYSEDGDDPFPIASFESPLSPSAMVTFKVSAGDEGGAAIQGARILVGQFSTRARALADTDPATVPDTTDEGTARKTSNTTDTAKFVPGDYDFMVEAPGYGVHKFPGFHLAAGASTISFLLPTNFASATKGATVVTSASQAVNKNAAGLLIDDTENTGVRVADAKPVAGNYAIVTLGGGAHLISHVNVSAAASAPPVFIPGIDDELPNNSGRYTALRQFEILTCNGSCANPTDFTSVFTSPEDAFPGKPLRPLQQDINLRSFSFAPVTATHVMLKVLSNQCTGQALFQGEQDSDPTFSTDCTTYTPPPNAPIGTGIIFEPGYVAPVAPASVAHVAEIQVFGSLPSASGPGSSSGGGSSGGSGSGSSSSGGSTGGEDGGRFGGALPALLLLPLLGAGLFGRRRRQP